MLNPKKFRHISTLGLLVFALTTPQLGCESSSGTSVANADDKPKNKGNKKPKKKGKKKGKKGKHDGHGDHGHGDHGHGDHGHGDHGHGDHGHGDHGKKKNPT